jgi:Carboxypeptidase regulatory-like domain
MPRPISMRFLWVGLTLVVGLWPSQMVGPAVGSISGAVVDPAGSAFVRAEVTATRADTGISRATDTNAAGIFMFANLELGTYNVAVTATGFGGKFITGVTADVSQQRGLNFTPAVAVSTETAVVTATEPLMNTSNGQVAGLVSQEQLVDMGSNGRSNEFGAELGGTIIPNKAFFEGEYAGLRETEGGPPIMAVPTAEERIGLVTINSNQDQVPLNMVALQLLLRFEVPAAKLA